jgi:ABC-type polysaccharide/polyol phosphate transport system ATPase subunit
MWPDGTIQAHHVWKRFKEDPTPLLLRAQVGQFRKWLGGQRRGWRWVLDDVNFSVEPGQSVGLVGINGSGKSTLLKILTRVMYPYAGRVEVAGRVGALIEVRAGIHPELSGRENIHLYGTLLGLSRREVAARFDQIVDFAQIETAVDRQVKFYSSGMQMRLGFAVAAFLEPSVLLVDEVLAVGDATFQQRCIDRMRDVLAQGTTLVFVSHDLATVEGICQRAIWLHQGKLREDGGVRQVLTSYRQALESVAEMSPTTGPVTMVKASVTGYDGLTPRTEEPAAVTVVLQKQTSTFARVCLGVSEGPAAPIFLLDHHLDVGEGEIEVRCDIAHLPLPRGRFFLWVGVFERGGELMRWHPASHFDVVGPDLDVGPPGIIRLSPVHVPAQWRVEEL